LDLKQSIAIPGTKIKIPMIEAIAAGAAVIGAYVLIKGQSSQSADVSTLPADTSTADTTSADATAALTGQLETMSQDLAALEAAQAAGAPAQNPGGGAGSVIGSGIVATVPASIPISEITPDSALSGLPGGLPGSEYPGSYYVPQTPSAAAPSGPGKVTDVTLAFNALPGFTTGYTKSVGQPGGESVSKQVSTPKPSGTGISGESVKSVATKIVGVKAYNPVTPGPYKTPTIPLPGKVTDVTLAFNMRPGFVPGYTKKAGGPGAES